MKIRTPITAAFAALFAGCGAVDMPQASSTIQESSEESSQCEISLTFYGILSGAQAVCNFKPYSKELHDAMSYCITMFGEDQAAEATLTGEFQFDEAVEEFGKEGACTRIAENFPEYVVAKAKGKSDDYGLPTKNEFIERWNRASGRFEKWGYWNGKEGGIDAGGVGMGTSGGSISLFFHEKENKNDNMISISLTTFMDAEQSERRAMIPYFGERYLRMVRAANSGLTEDEAQEVVRGTFPNGTMHRLGISHYCGRLPLGEIACYAKKS